MLFRVLCARSPPFMGSRRLPRLRCFHREKQVRLRAVRHLLAQVVSSSRELSSPSEFSVSVPLSDESGSAFHGVAAPLRGVSQEPSCDERPTRHLSVLDVSRVFDGFLRS